MRSATRRGGDCDENLSVAEPNEVAARAAARTQYVYQMSAVRVMMNAKKMAHVIATTNHIHQGGTHAVVEITVVVVVELDDVVAA